MAAGAFIIAFVSSTAGSRISWPNEPPQTSGVIFVAFLAVT
ncbi:hypothetical protein T03_16168 [Trichinella britovi]|uniref:Uncharacterized protein n=3 Tax=Trichinella TaxID=6333 RepID=A0A0V1DBC0_TRIBR|nr:hypothetical protein T05_4787 [Trichinella murrelli]KRX64391.1 hypothetical protein T09_1236 [Trichinella sp. T9]KRY18356.1 hypothetical protein T12_1471 [Trichinella patagoniensis]KRY58910.1 hypothetical protein T03_16168 [Trichinella britovi]KRZ93700.1 hypothetical protein T08_677 [Trichinella sp. T8]